MDVLQKRHGDTHHANDHYGVYLVYAQLVYIAVFLVVFKKIMTLERLVRGRRVNSKFTQLLIRLYNLDPLLHICIVLLFTMIPFPTLSFMHIMKDSHYTIFIRKFGKLSYCMLLLNMYLVIPRSNTFIIMSYLDSIRLHVWLSRFIFIGAILHSITFIVRWCIRGVFWEKIMKFDNFVGGLLFLIILVGTWFSLGGKRKQNYERFYIIHQLTMYSFILLTILHADPQVLLPFGLINICALIGYIVNHFVNTQRVQSIDIVSPYGGNRKDSTLSYYTMTLDSAEGTKTLQKILPGSHVRITQYALWNWKHWIYPSHPYSVVTTNNDDSIDMIIKKTKTELVNEVNTQYYICGVYPPSKDVQELVKPCVENTDRKRRVVFVAGGSGISFVLGLYRAILLQEQEQQIYTKLYWIIRSEDDLHVIKSYNKRDESKTPTSLTDFPEIEIFITNNKTEGSMDSSSPSPTTTTTIDNETGFEIVDVGVKSSSSTVELPQYLNIAQVGKIGISYHINEKFNILMDLQQNTDFIPPLDINDPQDEVKWLCCCGPSTLIEDGAEFCARNKSMAYIKEYYQL